MMMTSMFRRTAIPAVFLSVLAVWQLTSGAQPGEVKVASQLPKSGTQFSFEVIESYDAKYAGDTPGHTGRGGGLENTRPNVALGDPVYRGDKRLGTITGIVWSRVQGGLTIEFDPDPKARIAVGDVMWIDLNPTSNVEDAE